MTNERIQRRIESLLDAADAAVAEGDWGRARELALDVLAFAEENTGAQAFLDAAERRLSPPTERGRRGWRSRRRPARRGAATDEPAREEPRRGSLGQGFRQLRQFMAEERRAGRSGRRSGQPPRGQRPAASGRAIAILFTDVFGSTELTRLLGDERGHEVVQLHNQAVRQALASQGGREIKHTGDGIMASFLSASVAVECALDIQRRIDALAEEQDDQASLGVRIGINSGKAIAEDEDLFGTAVIMASRICDRAEPGQVLVSNVVQELCAGKTFELTSQGDATLKGFDEPVTLYEVTA